MTMDAAVEKPVGTGAPSGGGRPPAEAPLVPGAVGTNGKSISAGLRAGRPHAPDFRPAARPQITAQRFAPPSTVPMDPTYVEPVVVAPVVTGRARTSYSSRFSPDAIIAGIVGLAGLLMGLIAVTRAGFDGPMSDPVVQVLGWNHTATLGLIEVGLGLCLLLSAVSLSRSAELFFGAVLGIGSFVGKTPNETILLLDTFIAVMTFTGLLTVAVRAQFPNPDGLLIPGGVVGVTVERGAPKSAVLVPQAAVQVDQAGRYVLLVGDDKKVELRRITTGAEQGTAIVVTSGLKPGELIITEGIQKVRPGQVVSAAPAPGR